MTSTAELAERAGAHRQTYSKVITHWHMEERHGQHRHLRALQRIRYHEMLFVRSCATRTGKGQVVTWAAGGLPGLRLEAIHDVMQWTRDSADAQASSLRPVVEHRRSDAARRPAST
jgi:hypothetical protein